MPLYHYEIGLPVVDYPTEALELVYSEHAIQAASGDRYGNVRSRLPARLDMAQARIVEVEAEPERRKLRKMVLRSSLDSGRDLVLVVEPRGTRWFVRTCWVNEKSDNHRTLNRSNYVKP
jgi:hypothetical protein